MKDIMYALILAFFVTPIACLMMWYNVYLAIGFVAVSIWVYYKVRSGRA